MTAAGGLPANETAPGAAPTTTYPFPAAPLWEVAAGPLKDACGAARAAGAHARSLTCPAAHPRWQRSGNRAHHGAYATTGDGLSLACPPANQKPGRKGTKPLLDTTPLLQDDLQLWSGRPDLIPYGGLLVKLSGDAFS